MNLKPNIRLSLLADVHRRRDLVPIYVLLMVKCGGPHLPNIRCYLWQTLRILGWLYSGSNVLLVGSIRRIVVGLTLVSGMELRLPVKLRVMLTWKLLALRLD